MRVLLLSGSSKDLVPENVDQMKAGKADEICVSNHANQMEEQRIEPKKKNHATATENRVVAGLQLVATDHKWELMKENLGNKEVLENFSSELAFCQPSAWRCCNWGGFG